MDAYSLHEVTALVMPLLPDRVTGWFKEVYTSLHSTEQ
jgi:hypothetical protein